MKTNRQEEILRIIAKQDVPNQQELQRLLQERGYLVTQATVSRDVKELDLVKRKMPDGTCRYERTAAEPARADGGRMKNIFREGAVSCDWAQNMVVLRTMPGLASAAGAALDGMEIDGLVGSLAGDDTVFLVMRTASAAEHFCRELSSMLD